MSTALPSVLERILAHKREEVAARRRARPRVDPSEGPPVRDFLGALRRDRVALIAEVKQASPSRGVLRDEFDPAELARSFERGGAACLSVLTDEAFFHGRDAYLQAARAAVSLPVLRKDFVLDVWQVDESRALGADAVLLIAAALPAALLGELHEAARALGMAALVEVHTAAELEAVLPLRPPLIGVNNRNLHTFETSLAVTEALAGPALRSGALLVSESGIFTAEDVSRVAACGASAVLVGEALVREGDPTGKARELSAVPRG